MKRRRFRMSSTSSCEKAFIHHEDINICLNQKQNDDQQEDIKTDQMLLNHEKIYSSIRKKPYKHFPKDKRFNDKWQKNFR